MWRGLGAPPDGVVELMRFRCLVACDRQNEAQKIAELRKKRTFRKFQYRGIELEKLLDLTPEEFIAQVRSSFQFEFEFEFVGHVEERGGSGCRRNDKSLGSAIEAASVV